MKNNTFLSRISRFAIPAAVTLLGGVLVIDPDLVSIFLSRLVAWGISLAGIGFLLAAIFGQENRIRRVISWLVCSSLGSWLIASPLVPAAFAGRILGVLLILRGIRELRISHLTGARVLSIVLIVSGGLLFLLPMTASRLVFSLCGIVIALTGIGMGLERWREDRFLEGGDGSIIDAL